VSENDHSIIQRVKGGDKQAYAVLVDRYKDRVFSLVLSIVHSRETAGELAQDTFVKAFKSLHQFREEASFATWIYRIAYNTAISETRKRKINLVNLDEKMAQQLSASDDEEDTQAEALLRLKRAVSVLNPEEQAMIRLYYHEDKSVEEVSLCLNLSVANVKVKLFRLRAKLKNMMEEYTNSAVVV